MQTMRSLLVSFVVLLAGFVHSGSFAQTPKPAASTPATASSKAGHLLDLNTASAADLKALPGIGDAYSKRIVDGRPYTAKNQLVTKGIIPQATYDKIKDSIVARKPAK